MNKITKSFRLIHCFVYNHYDFIWEVGSCNTNCFKKIFFSFWLFLFCFAMVYAISRFGEYPWAIYSPPIQCIIVNYIN
jgi:hypothetical protein